MRVINKVKVCLLTVLLLGSMVLSSCQKKVDLSSDNRIYYEIFVRSFYDSDGDEIGDLKGVEEKLDYLSDLGITGIWFMPLFESPSYHKYDVTDYFTIDNEYGTNEDFQRLISLCHKKNIRVIVDFVINHTSSEHPWFQEAISYLRTLKEDEEPDVNECPYVDYYHFSKENLSGYSEATGTDWYYEAQFYYGMPDLNLQNEKVINELFSIMDYWQNLGVDGFRMDAAMHFEENDLLFNSEVLNKIYTHGKENNKDFYMVSEVWSSRDTILSFVENAQGAFFNFPFSDAEGMIIKTARGKFRADKFSDALVSYEEEYRSLNESYVDAPFIANHDMGRISNMLINDSDAMKFAAGLLMLFSGSPYLYYGEEIGLMSKGIKDENKRLPMRFSEDQKGEPKAADGADYVEQKFPPVSVQEKDESSILSYYKKAINVRNKFPVLGTGKTEVMDLYSTEEVSLLKKTDGKEELYILFNVTEEERLITLDFLSSIDKSYALTVNDNDITIDGNKVTMPGRSIFIFNIK